MAHQEEKNSPRHTPRPPNMVRAAAVRQLGRLGLRRLEIVAGRLGDGRVREPEAVELERLGVELRVVHHGLDGSAAPVADVELGAVREGEGPQRGAAGALWGLRSVNQQVFNSVDGIMDSQGRGKVWELKSVHSRASTGVMRADSLMKLSISGSPSPVFSKSA